MPEIHHPSPSESLPAIEPQAMGPLESSKDSEFAQRFTEHRPRLKQMLQFRMDPRLRARTDLSDVLQEAYIEAFHRLDHFAAKPDMSFYLWLRQVTIQRMIDLHRRHLMAGKRDVRQEVSLAFSDGQGASASANIARHIVDAVISPSQLVVRREMLQQLESTLEDLDALDREVLALRHFEELGNGEVAELLGISEAAASNRYVRALSRLRKLLEQIPDFFDGQ
jgi:RNA polymerase sigma-70 factor (ECF subfamily)